MISGKLSGITLGDRHKVRIMGVINLTKDSFYSGSVATKNEEIKRAALKLTGDGADIIDVGARSTAPYKVQEVSIETETRLLAGALRIISKTVDKPISVDTTRYEPAKKAFKEGATTLNDVYGFTEKDGARIADLVASRDASLLISAHEQKSLSHSNPVSSVVSCLDWSLNFAKLHGIDKRKITIDPGIGFFHDDRISNIDWNCSVINGLKELRKLERPVCVGVSRKRFIGQLLGRDDPLGRLDGSLGATAVSVYNGAHVIRTHDVRPTLDAVRIATAIREKGLIHNNQK